MWSIVTETARVLNESAIYLLFGFLLAGFLHVLLSRRPGFTSFLNERGSRSVFLAALLGVPLPLCSCSVLPAGLTLYRRGATKGATASFLISVPETDIVSILLTYGLLGPVVAIFRPLAALVTAIVAGHAVNVADRWSEKRAADAGETGEEERASEYRPERGIIWNALHYGFVKFFDDIVGSLVVGLVLGGLITALLPGLGLERFAGGSLLTMLAMLVVGIPIYVCATSSTPIAAGLVAGGLSPGAALVFLLAGPATNLASILVLRKELGRVVLIVYLASIAVVSVLMGLWLDSIVASPSLALPDVAPAMKSAATPVEIGAAVLFVALALLSFRRKQVVEKLLGRVSRATGIRISVRRAGVALLVLVVAGYFASGLFIVRPGERGMVTRFGRITQSYLGPGLYLRWPYPIGQTDIVSVDETRRLEFGWRTRVRPGGAPAFDRDILIDESWMLTGTEDIIDIKWAVHYQVKDTEQDVLNYTYHIAAAEQLVRSATESATREAVGGRNIDNLLTTERDELETVVKEKMLQPALDRCDAGIRIIDVSLLDVHAPPDVHRAFRDVASAAEDKVREINRAYEYDERVSREAAGQAAKTLADAEARSFDAVQRAEGESGAFLDELYAYREAEGITRLRLYLESMETVLPLLKKYVKLTTGPDDNVDLWLVTDKESAITPFVPPMAGRTEQRTEQ